MLPLSGAHRAGVPSLTLFYDRPLVVGPLIAANWSCRVANQRRTYNTVQVPPGQPDQVSCTVEAILADPDPGPDTARYSATPPDLLAQDGTPAGPFLEFPIAAV